VKRGDKPRKEQPLKARNEIEGGAAGLNGSRGKSIIKPIWTGRGEG